MASGSAACQKDGKGGARGRPSRPPAALDPEFDGRLAVCESDEEEEELQEGHGGRLRRAEKESDE